MDKKAELTYKQIKFCKEYAKNANASKSAILAGYSAGTAGTIGHENINKPEIMAKIEEFRAEREKLDNIGAEDVVAELKKIAFSNQNQIHKKNGKAKRLDKIDGSLISNVKRIEGKKGKLRTEYKIHDKNRALELLGKYFGIYKEKMDITSKGQEILKASVDLSKLDDAEIKQLQALNAKMAG